MLNKKQQATKIEQPTTNNKHIHHKQRSKSNKHQIPNDTQHTTNNQQQTTKYKHRITHNNKLPGSLRNTQQTTGDKRTKKSANDKQRTANNKRHTTNKQHTIFLPGESCGQRSLLGCCPWGHTESDMTEATQQQQQHTPYVITFWSFLSEDSVRFSHVRLFATLWTAACQASLSITSSWNLLKLMPIELVMASNHLILHHPLLLQPRIFPSISVFSNESILHIRWPKYWSFTFSINPSNEYSGLISFRMGWLDLLAVQGTLKSLLQHHSSKASILWRSAFFTVQLSHPYMSTGKTIALTRRTFVGKVL